MVGGVDEPADADSVDGVDSVGVGSVGDFAAGVGCASSDAAGCTCSSTHESMSPSAERSRLRSVSRWRAIVSTSPANCVRMDSSREMSSRRWRSASSVSDRAADLGIGHHGPGPGFGVGQSRPGLGLGFGFGLVHEFLGQQEGALQGVVGHGRCRCRGGGLRLRLRLFELVLQLLQRLLELGDTLGRLARAVAGLAHLLLERFGFDGHALQVLIDIVDVVTPQRLAKFDRPETVEARLLATRIRAVHSTILPKPPQRSMDGRPTQATPPKRAGDLVRGPE